VAALPVSATGNAREPHRFTATAAEGSASHPPGRLQGGPRERLRDHEPPAVRPAGRQGIRGGRSPLVVEELAVEGDHDTVTAGVGAPGDIEPEVDRGHDAVAELLVD
jgi:hypothetical protein